jgi:hypothetical protein
VNDQTKNFNLTNSRMILFRILFLALISLCPKSFECSLNCRLGYRTDSNGCLKCECQSCPSMDQCNKKCPSGYLKDLFGCDICECNEQCPPFSCNIFCPPGIGFVRSENGCPLCQCAISKSPPIENTSSCQVSLIPERKNFFFLQFNFVN